MWVVLENVPAKPANQGAGQKARSPLLHVICCWWLIWVGLGGVDMWTHWMKLLAVRRYRYGASVRRRA